MPSHEIDDRPALPYSLDAAKEIRRSDNTNEFVLMEHGYPVLPGFNEPVHQGFPVAVLGNGHSVLLEEHGDLLLVRLIIDIVPGDHSKEFPCAFFHHGKTGDVMLLHDIECIQSVARDLGKENIGCHDVPHPHSLQCLHSTHSPILKRCAGSFFRPYSLYFILFLYSLFLLPSLYRTTRTGHGAWRVTFSATLPMRRRVIPDLPTVPITMISTPRSSAT